MNGRSCFLLLALVGFSLTALDVPPPTSSQGPEARWMRADVQARLPATVVLASAPVPSTRGIELAVLPGPSCELALASLRPVYRLRLNGRPVSGASAGALCRVARVHRIEVRT